MRSARRPFTITDAFHARAGVPAWQCDGCGYTVNTDRDPAQHGEGCPALCELCHGRGEIPTGERIGGCEVTALCPNGCALPDEAER